MTTGPPAGSVLRRVTVTLARRARRWRAVRWVAEATRTQRARAAIRASGWFDADWYREQAGDAVPAGVDPLDHYLAVGSTRGWQPHPLFDPAHYLEHSPAARRSAAEPFTEFVTHGARRGDDPHPLFDTASYVARIPGAATHPRGAFGHFLQEGWRRRAWPCAELAGRDLPPAPDGGNRYVALARRAQRAHAAARGHADFERSQPTFDHAQARAFTTRMRRRAATSQRRPLVSVVVPTRDRADVLPVAVDAVLAQTYSHLEVLVVDDGSADHTADVVAGYTDPRVRWLPQEPAGVSAARNRGLAEARGDLVAYLDSDNAWVPEFLEVMVAFLDAEDARAAYAAIEMRTDTGVEYRGRPLHREALRERNYIDLNTLVHDRELVDEVGGFDERLPRVVDWELLLRLVDVTDLAYAPFVGVRYDATHERGDRISSRESRGWRRVVRHRELVDRTGAPDVVAGRTSVLRVALPDDPDPAAATAARANDAPDDVEVVVVDVGCAWAPAVRLRALGLARDDVVVERAVTSVTATIALDLAASRATGDVLVAVDPAATLGGDDLDRLAAAVRDGRAGLAQPSLVAGGGALLSTGQRIGPDGTPIVIGAGLPADGPDLAEDPARDAVHGHVFAVAAATYRHLGGLDPLYVRGGADLDLSLRARAADVPVRWVPTATAVVDLPATGRRWVPTRADERELRRHHPDRGPPTVAVGDRVGSRWVAGFRPVMGTEAQGPRLFGAVHQPASDPVPDGGWAVKAPRDAPSGAGLARALAGVDRPVALDRPGAWYAATAHLDRAVVAVWGGGYDPAPGQPTLLWVADPDTRVGPEDLVGVAHCVVATPRQAADVRSAVPGLPVEVLVDIPSPATASPLPASAARVLVAAVQATAGGGAVRPRRPPGPDDA